MSPAPQIEPSKEEGRPHDAEPVMVGEGEHVSMEAILNRQIEAAERLSAIEEAVTMIRDHLKKLNSDTQRSVDRIGQLEMHPATCEVKAAISEIRTILAAQNAARTASEAADQKWQERLKPFAWLLFMFILGLILGNASLFKSVAPKIVGG